MVKGSRSRRVAIVILRVVIALLFVPAIGVKLRYPVEWGHRFAEWGYPAWGAVAVSLAEIAGLLALWIRPLALIGVGVLTVTLTGATVTWVMNGPARAAAYPGLLLVLLAVLVWIQRPTT